MILPAQDIKNFAEVMGMIDPFIDHKEVVNGKSYGLSSCSYDFRIAQSLVLEPKRTALVSTIERVRIPDNVCGFICDKSTYARKFVSAFNTLFDPGFEGFATVELANLGEESVEYQYGDPVCQMVFYYLHAPTDRPYNGKYQNQSAGPQPAILE